MTILETIIPVFLFIALGKFLTVKKVLTDSGIACIKSVCVNVLLPVMAFDALISGTYSKDSIILIALEFFALFSCWGVGFYLKRFFDKSISGYVPYAMTTYEGGLFGWALISLLVGQKNMFYIVSMDIFSGVFGFTVMATGLKMLEGERLTKKEITLSIVKNPLIISVVLGFLGAALGWNDAIHRSSWAGIYAKTTSWFIQPLSPLILISIGSGLVFDKEVLKKGLKMAGIRYLIQIVVCVLVLTAIYYTVGLSWVLKMTLLMYFFCPTSFLISMYSRKKEAVEVTSAMLSVQILVALLVFVILVFVGAK